jgi:predicted DCC family thiol-disulfide oxidoreductase YuxK
MSSPPLPPPAAPQPVLLYDGECGLCQRIVRLLLRCDAAGRLHYAPLQSPPAQAYLRAQALPVQDFDSLVFVPDWNNPTPGAYCLRTDGALAAAQIVGGPLRWLRWVRWVPRAGRDAAYRLIARFRFALFGRPRPSPLPNPAWQARFLSGMP